MVKQLLQIDSIITNICSEKGVVISDKSVDEIKAIAIDFVNKYNVNPKHT